MRNILKTLEDDIILRSNSLRFNHSDKFDLVLKSEEFSNLQKIAFLKLIFGWDLLTCKKVVESEKSFVEITNELNANGLLN